MHKIYSMVSILFLIVFSNSLFAQCWKDFYGKWKTLEGVYLEVRESDKKNNIRGITRIINDLDTFNGAFFIEGKNCSISSHRKINIDSSYVFERLDFKYEVINANRESILIQPISEAMIDLFGPNKVKLYNENYITYNDFELNFISYSRLHLDFEIKINQDSIYLIRENWNGNKKKYYASSLRKKDYDELKDLIFRSRLLTMSLCEYENHAVDVYPIDLKLKINELFFDYEQGRIHNTVVPLMAKFYQFEKELKWKRIKNGHVINKK